MWIMFPTSCLFSAMTLTSDFAEFRFYSLSMVDVLTRFSAVAASGLGITEVCIGILHA